VKVDETSVKRLSGFTFPFSFAKHQIQRNTMAFILQRDKQNQKCFAIFEALDYDFSESADYFREKTADLPPKTLIKLRDIRPGNEGRTLLHNAARNGSLPIVLSLIRYGHQIDAWDSCVSKVTPLMDAILNCHVEVAIVLIEAGADLFKEDINGENGLHYAARTGNCRLLRNILSVCGLNRIKIMELASSKTVKKQLPEDVATTPMIREILEGLRLRGQHAPIFSKVVDLHGLKV
jgi:hypothetical protein